MALWLVYNKKDDFNAVAKACGISPVTARLIRNRDVIGPEAVKQYLSGTLNDLHDPFLLHDMDKAVGILGEKITGHRKIRVIGDYDVDGICSSFILWRLLTYLGGAVSVDLPDRKKDGYGINARMVQEAISDGVDTIITCDNGIAAAEPLQLAKDAGLTVIVTDHHEVPYVADAAGKAESRKYLLPPADAIVEPKLMDPETLAYYYPFTEICGAEVVYKLAQALLGMPDISGNLTDDRTPEQGLMRELLGFAAIATICDVMPLQDENRILVRYGLQEAQRTENVGLHSLILASGLGEKPLNVYQVGFVIGPCLNASGRLDTAERALGLFMEDDPGRAMALAGELKELNENRKSMTEQGLKAAEEQIRLRGEELRLRAGGTAAGSGAEASSAEGKRQEGPAAPALRKETWLDRVLILYLPGTHESVAGIIAGRVKEKYFRPTFVLTDSEEDGILKGSGRSIEGYDMYAEMNRCREYFTKFGGHKMAAGFSLPKEKLDDWREEMNRNCTLEEKDMCETIHIDMQLPPYLVTEQLTEELSVLEPCGTGNPRPLFVTRNLRLLLQNIYGKNQNVIRLRGSDDSGHSYSCILFRSAADAGDLTDGRVHVCNVVYYPDINEYRGRKSLQFVIRDYRVID